MAFWRSETLKARIPEQKLIEPFEPDRVSRCAYELSVGGQAYITSNPGDKTKLGDSDKIVIPPGQFGLLVTKETVTVPDNAIAFISIRATIKFQGLINVSGFHVDPGYKRPLKFAVYNAGSQAIILDQGEPVFLVWFADLDGPTEDLYKPRPSSVPGISSDDVRRIYGEVASPGELKKLFDELRNDIDKKFHEVDLGRQYNRWMLGVLIALVVTTIGWVVIRPALGGSAGKKDPTVSAQTGAAKPGNNE
jgi:dCTP deaminase